MIRAIILMIPKGNEAKAREIGRIEIANVGGTDASGDYEVRIPKRAGAWKWGQVTGFPRKRLGPQDLLLRALAACLGRRNPEAAALAADDGLAVDVRARPVADEEEGGAPRTVLVLPEGLPADEVAFLERVARERVEQLRRHGYTPERDDRYVEGELGRAGAAYLAAPSLAAVSLWPWWRSVAEWAGLNAAEIQPGDTTRFLTRKPRLDQLATGMALGLAEAGRRLRAGEG